MRRYSILIIVAALTGLLLSACQKDVIDVHEDFGKVVIDSMTAKAGPEDSYFEVFGKNFNYRKEDVKAYIGNSLLVVEEASLERLLVHIPAGVTTGLLRFVFNRYYSRSNFDFGGQLDSTIAVGDFRIDNTIVPIPVITSLSTNTARANEQLIINGYNFFSSEGLEVYIGDDRANVVNATATQISISIPASAQPGIKQLIIKRGNTSSRPQMFEVLESLNTLKAIFYTGSLGIMKTHAEADGSVITEVLYKDDDIVSPAGLIVDKTRGFIYWVNPDVGEVMRGSVDGQSPAMRVYTPANGLVFLFDLALDETTNTLYISNYSFDDTKQVFKGDLNNPGSGITTLYNFSTQVMPFGMAINTQTDKIYWTDIINGNVVEANADGTGTPQVLFNGFSSNLSTIAIDKAHASLFILDAQIAIYAGKLDGTNQLSSVITPPEANMQTYDLAFDETGGYIYWFDKKDDITSLYRAKADGTGIEPVFADLDKSASNIAVFTD